MNYLLDVNIIIDYYNTERGKKFPASIQLFEHTLEKDNFYLSTSSLDNIAYILADYMRMDFGYTLKQRKFLASKVVEFLVKNFKLAKTPSYVDIDYEDIEDSQIIASAKAVDAKVLTRDREMLEKYADIAISPIDFLKTENQTTNTIDFANLNKQYFRYLPELEEAMDSVLNQANYIMGDPVKELEENLCDFTDAKYAVTCSSGTDALLLAMMALGIKPGDEIITTPFTFIATAETIAFLGAKPVFVDIDEQTYNINPEKIEAAITDKTKAIIPVSLYGQPADMDAIQAIVDQRLKAKNQKMHIIIDGAQSFGATYKGKAEVHHCDIYTTSFFPAKPLGCFGDGGAILTKDQKLADKIQSLRIHGQTKRYRHKYIGMGARMDTIQAAVLNVKIKHYSRDLKRRQEVAERYTELLTSHFSLFTPIIKDDRTSAWAQYSIRVQNRDELQVKLKEAGIPTAIHYPVPMHMQECFGYLGYRKGDFPLAEAISDEISSLPMNPYLSDEEIAYVIKAL